MDTTKKILSWTVGFSLFFAFYGFIYEYSYFYELNKNVWDILNFRHYLLSGLYHVGVPFLILCLFNHMIKFFSKDIGKDDWEVIIEKTKNEDINSVIWFARAGFFIAIIFWLISIFDNFIFSKPTIYTAYLYILIVVLSLFLIPILKAPKSAIYSIIIFLLISLGFIFSAAAVGQSRIDLLHLNERNIIRDDSIVFIKKLDNGTHEFIPKEIKLPKHLDKILENFE